LENIPLGGFTMPYNLYKHMVDKKNNNPINILPLTMEILKSAEVDK